MTLLKEIELLRSKLNNALENNNFMMTSTYIITISEELDELLVIYQKQFNTTDF